MCVYIYISVCVCVCVSADKSERNLNDADTQWEFFPVFRKTYNTGLQTTLIYLCKGKCTSLIHKDPQNTRI